MTKSKRPNVLGDDRPVGYLPTPSGLASRKELAMTHEELVRASAEKKKKKPAK